MQASEIQALMATHRVFGALPDGTRQALASQAQVQAFQADDIVLAESEMPGRLGWLLAILAIALAVASPALHALHARAGARL